MGAGCGIRYAQLDLGFVTHLLITLCISSSYMNKGMLFMPSSWGL